MDGKSGMLGLIAGNGRLPLIVAREARKRGREIALCAIQGETDRSVLSESAAIEWIKLGELQKIIKFFKREHVTEAVMAGKITKTNLFKGDVRPDFEMIKVLATTRNHSDDSLLGAIAGYMDKQGVCISDSTAYLTEDCLPGEGVLTRRKPSAEQLRDIRYGWHLAKEMGRLDVGQTVVVKKEAILAIEAIEGTDEAIRRGAALGRRDVVVVKIAKPNQDFRFDVPTVGLETLAVMIEAGASVLAFEAGKTIVLDRVEFVKKANENKIIVTAMKDI